MEDFRQLLATDFQISELLAKKRDLEQSNDVTSDLDLHHKASLAAVDPKTFNKFVSPCR